MITVTERVLEMAQFIRNPSNRFVYVILDDNAVLFWGVFGGLAKHSIHNLQHPKTPPFQLEGRLHSLFHSSCVNNKPNVVVRQCTTTLPPKTLINLQH